MTLHEGVQLYKHLEQILHGYTPEVQANVLSGLCAELISMQDNPHEALEEFLNSIKVKTDKFISEKHE